MDQVIKNALRVYEATLQSSIENLEEVANDDEALDWSIDELNRVTALLDDNDQLPKRLERLVQNAKGEG